MKILRTILWVLAALGFLIFAFYNWNRVELKLWQNLVLETPLPALVLVVFALGFVPMWGVHRSVLWRQNRRIRALENSLKNTAYTRERDATPAAAPTVVVFSETLTVVEAGCSAAVPVALPVTLPEPVTL